MRILIVSDIHANEEALSQVMEKETWDTLWCLGDTMGYGPDPNSVLSTVMSNAQYILRGNHDLALSPSFDPEVLRIFNPMAQWAIRYHRKVLEPKYLVYLEMLEPMMEFEVDARSICLVHASPLSPYWGYLNTVEEAQEADEKTSIRSKFTFMGHTHKQGVFYRDSSGTWVRKLGQRQLPLEAFRENKHQIFINPGSVGQPRDGLPEAAYAVFDTKEKLIELKRVAYDVQRTIEKLKDLKAPRLLWERLELGY